MNIVPSTATGRVSEERAGQGKQSTLPNSVPTHNDDLPTSAQSAEKMTAMGTGNEAIVRAPFKHKNVLPGEKYKSNVANDTQFEQKPKIKNATKIYLDKTFGGRLSESALKKGKAVTLEGKEAQAGALEAYLGNNQDKAMMTHLKEKGVNPNAYLPGKIWGNTPILSLAANGFNNSVARMLKLFSGGLDLRFKSITFNTNVLHTLLYKNYKNRNHLDYDTPTQRFYEESSTLNLTKEILRQCPEMINDQTKDGDTALHIACVHRDFELVSLLLANGANPNAVNNNGQKPSDMLSMSYEETNNYLLQNTGGALGNFVHHPYRIDENELADQPNVDRIKQALSEVESSKKEFPSPEQIDETRPQAQVSGNLAAYFAELLSKGIDIDI